MRMTTAPQAEEDIQLTRMVYNSIRDPPTFHTTLLTSSSRNLLLLTLWKTSYCPACRTITPLIEDILNKRAPLAEDRGVGLGLAEVELDSPDVAAGSMMELGVEFGVTSVPTLLAFGPRRREPRFASRVTDVMKMTDREWLQTWIDEEMAKPEGGGGAGGILGRLFT